MSGWYLLILLLLFWLEIIIFLSQTGENHNFKAMYFLGKVEICI